MKRVVKRLLKPVWRASGVLRRPIANRAEAFLRGCLTIPPAPPSEADGEVAAVLDHVVRELVRLQDEVDRLRAAVEDSSAPRRGEARRAG